MSNTTLNIMRVAPFLQLERCEIGISIKSSETVAWPPKGLMPTPEEGFSLGGIGVRVAEGSGVKMVGLAIGNDAFAENSAVEIVRDGGAEQTRAYPSAYAGQNSRRTSSPLLCNRPLTLSG